MATVESVVAALTAEIADLERQAVEWERRARTNRAALERKQIALAEVRAFLTRASNGASTQDEQPRRRRIVPANRELVEQVVRHASRPIADVDVMERMTRLGWTSESTDPLNIVRTYLSRLGNDGIIRRVGPMLWEAVPKDTESPAAPTAGLSVPVPTSAEGGGASGGTGQDRVRDDPSSWQAEHRDHDHGAPVGG